MFGLISVLALYTYVMYAHPCKVQ